MWVIESRCKDKSRNNTYLKVDKFTHNKPEFSTPFNLKQFVLVMDWSKKEPECYFNKLHSNVNYICNSSFPLKSNHCCPFNTYTNNTNNKVKEHTFNEYHCTDRCRHFVRHGKFEIFEASDVYREYYWYGSKISQQDWETKNLLSLVNKI